MTRPVTVDTGGPDDVFIGAVVEWLHTPSGGYGFTMPVEAKVLAFTRRPRERVRIQVTTKAGDTTIRSVDAQHLRWRT